MESMTPEELDELIKEERDDVVYLDDVALEIKDFTVVQGIYFPWAGVGFAVIEKEKQWTK